MYDTLIFPSAAIEAPQQPTRLPPPTSRRFAELLHQPEPVVEVLAAVATDFRQGEASMLNIINKALSRDCMTRAQLLQLRARMTRYSFEVDALTNLLEALVHALKSGKAQAA